MIPCTISNTDSKMKKLQGITDKASNTEAISLDYSNRANTNHA